MFCYQQNFLVVYSQLAPS